MLNKLKKIDSRQLLDLGDHLDEVKQVEFNYKGKKVLVRKIPEDFRIYLDEKPVCQCVYGGIYNDNRKLVEELIY